MRNNSSFARIHSNRILLGFALSGMLFATDFRPANAQEVTSEQTVAAPAQAAVAGRLNLQGIAPDASFQVFKFEFRPTDGSDPVSLFAEVGPDGAFYFGAVPVNDYVLHIDGARYLATDLNVTVSGTNAANLTATMRAGDVNGDGVVDVTDMGVLINAYNSAVNDGTGSYNTDADLNRDGVVDVADFSLLIANYGEQSDP